MALRASREIVIQAPTQAILDVLADAESWPDWSAVYTSAEVVDRYEDGRPRHARVAIRVLRLNDKELLEFHWGPSWVVWDANPTSHQHALHVEYRMRGNPLDGSTLVRLDVTVEPGGPILDFVIKKAMDTILDDTTTALHDRVLQVWNAAVNRPRRL